MARMIPDSGPQETDSKGERELYWVLKTTLSDDYTVIHSLPWLCSAVSEVGLNAAPTGEIDLLVIHPENGVLALEVKSGKYHVENSRFFHDSRKFSIDPVRQTRRNVHGLARWLGNKPSLRLKIGYGFIFPDSDFQNLPTSPGMYDASSSPPQPIYIDYLCMPDVAQHITALMIYWKGALSNGSLGKARVQELIDYLTPTIDGQPQWGNRILYDNKVWLKLTEEQSAVVRNVLRNETSLITGWPGTGKTLIAIESARKLAVDGRRILVISFNISLTEFIRNQLADYPTCTVLTWHALCREAAKVMGRTYDEDGWYKTTCVGDLNKALSLKLMGHYDALVVDESQALSPTWCATLATWFQGKTKAFFCDETQVFSFERESVSLDSLSKILGVNPFPLTIILRMPKAVTDILAEVVPPKLQHSSPRVMEMDTALEIITLTPCEDLVTIRQALLDGGVDESDIVILRGSVIGKLYYEFLVSSKVSSKSIAKFRGMEASIILVLGAEQLSTAELFSAYSRATSKCIVIYNAHNRFWRSKQGFQSRLQSNPQTFAMLKKEQVALRIKNLIATSTSASSLDLKSLNIAWAFEWSAWLIEVDVHETQVMLWLEYLCDKLAHPIFFWHKDTLTKFYQAHAYKFDDRESVSLRSLILDQCETCNRLTPHTDNSVSECCLCAASNTKVLSRDLKVIEELRLLDAIITSQLSRERTIELQPNLPICIAAAAALLRASRRKLRNHVLLVPLPVGRSLYLSAFAFMQSRIATHPSNSLMSVSGLADEIYNRFRSLGHLTLLEWRKIFANAMGTFYQKGYVTKAGKGMYRPVEDSEAPVPRRSTQISDNLSEEGLELIGVESVETVSLDFDLRRNCV
ncbi:nuclease-related domain-containing DEAD/DEAH box helicase [Pseudomonas syringae]|uniref:nuclease-related domain-containing DEAD/DEAH box helicase n=1 Tax=Pseudomonas syringae TaxID=317 RepID=UPI000E318412|nr:NERD domain-containing protein [Pseudomonas syringae]